MPAAGLCSMSNAANHEAEWRAEDGWCSDTRKSDLRPIISVRPSSKRHMRATCIRTTATFYDNKWYNMRYLSRTKQGEIPFISRVLFHSSNMSCNWDWTYSRNGAFRCSKLCSMTSLLGYVLSQRERSKISFPTSLPSLLRPTESNSRLLEG